MRFCFGNKHPELSSVVMFAQHSQYSKKYFRHSGCCGVKGFHIETIEDSRDRRDEKIAS